jgi:heme-degrading monooxygenase HmoA
MSTATVIVRMWRGAVRTEDRETYAAYIEKTGLAEYRATPGNIDAWMLMRDLPGGVTEVITVSRWRSREAIVGFAGDDIDRAVFYPDDDRYLVERDVTVRHYVQVG